MLVFVLGVEPFVHRRDIGEVERPVFQAFVAAETAKDRAGQIVGFARQMDRVELQALPAPPLEICDRAEVKPARLSLMTWPAIESMAGMSMSSNIMALAPSFQIGE